MKDELRYKYKIKRKYFQHAVREVADGAIYDLFFELFLDKDSFLIYNSFGSEADTHKIIDELLRRGKQVYLPKVVKKDMVAVRYTGGADELKEGAYGIYEPQGQAFEGDIDVVVIPLLAVNKKGFRLGYGGGYYDRFLKDKNCLKVGIGYYLQVTDEFEENEWDVPLDIFICEKGVMYFEQENK
jgi:5-formyltetrahydrofolate cyclo-ligase